MNENDLGNTIRGLLDSYYDESKMKDQFAIVRSKIYQRNVLCIHITSLCNFR